MTRSLCAIAAALGLLALAVPLRARQPATVETLVCIRHGEKTPEELGQLSAQGLNRALALPPVLVGKFGRPQYLFAPDPSERVGNAGHEVCYVRPLATIEPTAIFLKMAIGTTYGYRHIKELEQELDQPKYANALVFIAWEHGWAQKFARNIVQDHGGDGTAVPDWKQDDYDSIYVVRITRAADGTATAAFTLDHEGLGGQSAAFPQPAAP